MRGYCVVYTDVCLRVFARARTRVERLKEDLYIYTRVFTHTHTHTHTHRHKKICIPSFEQARSMEAFVGATREELSAQVTINPTLCSHLHASARAVVLSGRYLTTFFFLAVATICRPALTQETVDLYSEMRIATLNVVR